MSMNLYEFYKDVNEKKISFCYSGPIIQEGLEGIATTLRKKLDADDVSFSASQSIFSIFIEEMQNILNYSVERQLKIKNPDSIDLSVGIFVIGQTDDGYFVQCGNKVFSKDVEKLRQQIDNLKVLSKDELKSLYKECRKKDIVEGSKGAGLGLIEIARKAGKPMEYQFTKIDEEYSFFSLTVEVWRSK